MLKNFLFWMAALLIPTFLFVNEGNAMSLQTKECTNINCLLKNEIVFDKNINVDTKTENKTVRYEKALIMAQRLSDQSHNSKRNIFLNLTSRMMGFSDDEAQYAVDNIKVDWRENALLKAISYNRISPWSKKGLYNQLVSRYGEQFTPNEAQYAVDNIKADWKKNALDKGKDLKERYGYPQRKVYSQLLYEGYTQDEVRYAIKNLF